MSKLPFDYSADFKLKKIFNEQEKLMQAKKKREIITKEVMKDKRFQPKNKNDSPKKIYFKESSTDAKN
jgi:hypothetical protein